LVLPTYQGSPTTFASSAQTTWPRIPQTFYDNNDISVHPDGTAGTTIAANTLADLTKRECRFYHRSDTTSTAHGFPHRLDQSYLLPFGGVVGATYTIDSMKPRYGEDVILTNVLAFDVQVWDPNAPVVVNTTSNVALTPGDPGYSGAGSSTGAFVDLNWQGSTSWASGGSTDPFKTQGHTKSQLNATATTEATYDTWSYHYEHDGLDQDGDGNIDQGTDGFDNDPMGQPGYGVVDDPGERETSPPYPVPLRGIKIKIRCYEPDARQVHEVDVVESFVPQ